MSVAHPAHKGAGFPPFDTATYPSQIFWLAITFGALFLVLWRVGGPMIAGTIATRRSRIDGDLAAAEKARADANSALAAYQTALAGARSRAHGIAEEMRKGVADEIERAKAKADGEATAMLEQAQKKIDSARDSARGHISGMAEEAVSDIVRRLLGDGVNREDAEGAVKAVKEL